LEEGLNDNFVAQATNLAFLKLDGTLLRSSIPDNFSQLNRLELFTIEDAFLTGDLSFLTAGGSGFPLMKRFWCGANPSLGGTIPSEIGSMTSIASFSFARGGFSGVLPSQIANSGQLVEAWFYENQFEGQIPSEFGDNEQLQILQFQRNQFSKRFAF